MSELVAVWGALRAMPLQNMAVGAQGGAGALPLVQGGACTARKTPAPLDTVDKIKAVSSHASQRAHGPGIRGVLWRALASPGPSHSDFLLPDESRPVPMGWLFLVLCRG